MDVSTSVSSIEMDGMMIRKTPFSIVAVQATIDQKCTTIGKARATIDQRWRTIGKAQATID
jgi:hypothetical protein